MKFEYKKIYYYTICLIAFFVIMWGAIDTLSATISLVSVKLSQGSLPTTGEIPFDQYYQNKMSWDRLWDSLSRLLIAGAFFTYAKLRLNRLEEMS